VLSRYGSLVRHQLTHSSLTSTGSHVLHVSGLGILNIKRWGPISSVGSTIFPRALKSILWGRCRSSIFLTTTRGLLKSLRPPLPTLEYKSLGEENGPSAELFAGAPGRLWFALVYITPSLAF